MLGSLALLIVSFVKLDSKWCSALVQRVSSFDLIPLAIGTSDINWPFSPGAIPKSKFRLSHPLFILPLSLMEENQQLSDVFTTLHILSNSLMQGHALPACLPKLRERLVYHEIHTGRRSMNSSLIRSMFSQPVSTGMENVQAAETDSSLEGSSGGNVPMAEPVIMGGSGTAMELEDLTLDVLLVSLRFDYC
jgi:hypothetical protein